IRRAPESVARHRLPDAQKQPEIAREHRPHQRVPARAPIARRRAQRVEPATGTIAVEPDLRSRRIQELVTLPAADHANDDTATCAANDGPIVAALQVDTNFSRFTRAERAPVIGPAARPPG